MIEHIIGSKTRVRLLALLFEDPLQTYFVRELTRKLNAQINAIRNELNNLKKANLIIEVKADPKNNPKASQEAKRKYFKINVESIIYPELRALFMKERVVAIDNFVADLSKIGTAFYVALAGFFVGEANAPTDILIVGKFNKNKFLDHMKLLEKNVQHELNYTLMTPEEFKYRRDVTDRFLYRILEDKKNVVHDTLKEMIIA